MSMASLEDAAGELRGVWEKVVALTYSRNQHRVVNPMDAWHERADHPEALPNEPPPQYQTYLKGQSEAVALINSCALAGLIQWQQIVSRRTDDAGGRRFDPAKVSLLLIGSAAKLEFFKGSSDLDFLAILHADDASTAAEYFAELKRQLAQAAVSAGLVREGRVDVSGGPGATFLTPKDLVSEPGGQAEPNWAASFRAQLVTEARTISFAPECEQLLHETQKHYSAFFDLANGLYPLISTRLLLNVSIGGVLGQAVALREEADKKNDHRVIKAVVSREWSSAINLLMVHVFYWQAVAQVELRNVTAAALTGALSRTPLHQLCVDCAEAMERLIRSDTIEKLRRQLFGMGVPSSLVRKIVGSVRTPKPDFPGALAENDADLENGRRIKPREYHGGWLRDIRDWLSPADPEPLWASYLDAMVLYGEVREGAELSQRDLDKLMKWSRRFGRVLETANSITRVVMDHDMRSQLEAEPGNLAGYKKLIRCHAASRLLS
jgi:hypothetical protein